MSLTLTLESPAPSAPRRFLIPLTVLALAAVAALLWIEHLEIALNRRYSVDEFQYAHGSWLIAQGKVIYRDFFEHHFPLIHQLLAAVWLFGDEDPNHIVRLRLAMLPFVLATALAAWRIARESCGRWAAVAAVAVLAVPTYVSMATQIRPDPIALAFFLWAVALLYGGERGAWWRSFASGFCWVVALWGSLKAAVYGVVLPAAWAIDVATRRRTPLIPAPRAFAAGVATATVPIAVYLTWTASWGAWWEWGIRWSFIHQAEYPGRLPWLRNFTPLVLHSPWILPFGVVGAVAMVRRLRTSGWPAHPDVLVLGGLATGLASFAWQTAPYLYSLIPFSVLLAVVAARGIVATFRGLLAGSPVGPYAAAIVALLLAGETARALVALERLQRPDNVAQHQLFERVRRLVRAEEPVYETAGGQVARPSVHFFYFLEAATLKLKRQVIAEELPRAMLETGCVAYIPSDRFRKFPERFQRFLLTNYLPYDRQLWLWGRRYPVEVGGGLGESFYAIRTGRYFVHPPSALGDGQSLAVDGRAVETPILELAKGPHRLDYRGRADQLFVLWLPADGVPWEPQPALAEVPTGAPAAG